MMILLLQNGVLVLDSTTISTITGAFLANTALVALVPKDTSVMMISSILFSPSALTINSN